MEQASRTSKEGGWLDATGLPHILRSLGLAVDKAKLGIALIAVLLTFVLGGVLDWVWTLRPGVAPSAIVQFVDARERGAPYIEPTGDAGIFNTWREYQRRCVLGLLVSAVDWLIPSDALVAGTPVDAYVRSHSHTGPLRNFINIVYGVCWMLRHHTLFFILFGAGALLIWSWAGGAICRAAAVQFTQGEKLTAVQALRFGRERLIGGFAVAPCIPLIFIALIMVLMLLGGMVLRIPVLGDLLGGLGFGFGILGGFLMLLLLIGLFVGGNLFWPVVATEGSDAFDAFSRGVSYPLSKPWKTILYGLISLVYAGLCWLFVNLLVYYVLMLTRGVVGLGATWFGLWPRGGEGNPAGKLEALWPLSGFNALYAMPDRSLLSWHEYLSAVFVGLWVLLAIALMWAFLASFYFSNSTVVYFLLRRDVDNIPLDDIWVEEDDGGGVPKPLAPVSSQQSASASPNAAERSEAGSAGVAVDNGDTDTDG